jgi:hypothetical protein
MHVSPNFRSHRHRLATKMASSASAATPSSSWKDQCLCSSMHAPPASPPTEELEPKENDREENLKEDSTTLQHKLQPGDHVIRWEMLPIVYPIQIHGIVLECEKDYVKIIDFGLTSYQQEGAEEEAAEGDTDNTNRNAEENNTNDKETTNEQEDATTDDQAANIETTVQESRTPEKSSESKRASSLSKSKSTVEQTKLSSTNHAVAKSMLVHQKSRLNITTIRDQKEVNAWKRVNYGENLFSKSLKKSNSWWKMGTSMKNATATMEEEVQQEVENGETAASNDATTPAETSNS